MSSPFPALSPLLPLHLPYLCHPHLPNNHSTRLEPQLLCLPHRCPPMIPQQNLRHSRLNRILSKTIFTLYFSVTIPSPQTCLPPDVTKGAILNPSPDPLWQANWNDVDALSFNDTVAARNYAYLSYNAYVSPDDTDSIPVMGQSLPFGWKGSGVRGYYTVYEAPAQVVMSFKGTNVQIHTGIVSTVRVDKINLFVPPQPFVISALTLGWIIIWLLRA